MRNSILSLCLIVASSLYASGVSAPDFTGTWVRDASRSDEMSGLVDGKVQSVSVDLVVQQMGNTLHVEYRWSYKPPTQTSYLLTSEETTVTDDRGDSFVYQTTWTDGHLVIDGFSKVSTPFGNTEQRKKEEWSLSADGRTLTITTTTASNSPFGKSTRTQLYNKQVQEVVSGPYAH